MRTGRGRKDLFFIYDTAKGEMYQLYSLGEQPSEAIAASPNGSLHTLRTAEDGSIIYALCHRRAQQAG